MKVKRPMKSLSRVICPCSQVALSVKNPPVSAGGAGGRVPSPGREDPLEGNGNPLQCSGLEKPMDRGVWRATVRWIAESDTTERLSTHCELWIFVAEKSCQLLICLALLKPDSVL